MSIANNKLSKIPSSVLSLTNSTIQYLSLADNNFYNIFKEENTTFGECDLHVLTYVSFINIFIFIDRKFYCIPTYDKFIGTGFKELSYDGIEI